MKRQLTVFVSVLTITGIIVTLSGGSRSAEALVPRVHSLVSINNTGDNQGGNGDSPITPAESEMSRDGRYVVFNSDANNLVAGDTNGVSDVFVRDTTSNITTRVSVSSSGVQTDAPVNRNSGVQQVVSSTGRYVVFASEATNLIDGQTISSPQIYMRDTLKNTTTLVTKKSDGTLGNGAVVTLGGVSNDGRFVMWQGARNTNLYSDTIGLNSLSYMYVVDLKDQSFRQLNEQGLYPDPYYKVLGGQPTMSCDGSIVAFSTPAPIDSNDLPSTYDIYLFDLRNGLTSKNITKVTTSKNANNARISCNGEYLTFKSNDSNLSTLIPASSTVDHLFLYDRINETISLVDSSSSGIASTKSASYGSPDDNGNVAFTSNEYFPNPGSQPTTVQLYLKHRATGLLEMVSVTSSGTPSTGTPAYSVISANGKVISYRVHTPTNLISSDTNGKADVIISQTGL